MRLLLVIFLLSCLIGVRPMGASAQENWRRIRLGDSTGDGSFGASLAIDSSYGIHLLYASHLGVYRQWYGRYADEVLSTPRLLETRSGGTYSTTTNYAMAEDSVGGLHAVIGVGMPSACLLYTAIGPNGPGTFEPITASSCGALENDPSLAVDGSGTIHLVWERERRIYYRRRSPSGAWSEEVLLSPDSPPVALLPSIVVGPHGGLHITYQVPGSGGDTLFYVYGSASSFTSPRILCVTAGLNAVPIHFDRRGDGHLLYLKPEKSGYLRTVFHAVLRNGIVEPPEVVVSVDTSYWSLQQVWSTMDKSGSIHLMIGRYDRKTPFNQSLLYTNNLTGRWKPVQNLVPDLVARTVTANVSTPIVVRDSMIAISYYAEERSGIFDATLLVSTFRFPPLIAIAPDTIDFGEVPLDSCRTVNYWIRNATEYSTDSLRSGEPSLLGISPGGSFMTQVDTSRGIAPSDSVEATLRFCPDSSGTVQGMLVFDSNGGQDTVVVVGRGAEREPIPHVLWFDTTHARVGERARLLCRAWPPLTARERISGLDLFLSIEQTSLFPRRTIGVNPTLVQGNLTMAYRSGRVEIHGTSTVGMYLSGDTLFGLELEGLLTAVPRNSVRIDSARFVGNPILPETHDGEVELAGCEIGRLVGLGRQGGILKVYPNPIGHDATLQYYAPAGTTSELRISDPSGVLIGSVPLPASTGAEQEFLLSLAGYPPGTYLVRLLVGQSVGGSVMVVVR